MALQMPEPFDSHFTPEHLAEAAYRRVRGFSWALVANDLRHPDADKLARTLSTDPLFARACERAFETLANEIRAEGTQALRVHLRGDDTKLANASTAKLLAHIARRDKFEHELALAKLKADRRAEYEAARAKTQLQIEELRAAARIKAEELRAAARIRAEEVRAEARIKAEELRAEAQMKRDAARAAHQRKVEAIRAKRQAKRDAARAAQLEKRDAARAEQQRQRDAARAEQQMKVEAARAHERAIARGDVLPPDPEGDLTFAIRSDEGSLRGSARALEYLAGREEVLYLWGGGHALGDGDPDAFDRPVRVMQQHLGGGRIRHWVYAADFDTATANPVYVPKPPTA